MDPLSPTNATADTSAPSPAVSFLLLPKLPALDDTFGALLIGTFLSLILYGISIHQAYRYCKLYLDSDGMKLKLFVAWILAIETLFTALCMYTCYFYLVVNYLRPLELLRGLWSLQMIPMLTGLMIFAIQCFFARRVYLLRPHYRPLVAASVVFAVVAFGFATAESVKAVKVVTIERFNNYKWIDCAAAACAVVSDGLTTIMLIVILRQSRTGFKQTDHILDRLILYTVNTGLLTTIFNILAVIFASVYRDKLIDAAIVIIDAKIYSNSLLAVLNNRRSLTSPCGTSEAGISVRGFAETSTENSSKGITTQATASRLWTSQDSVGCETIIEIKADPVGSSPTLWPGIGGNSVGKPTIAV
ncbi:hypothetical protein C8Q77DRAFT_1159589 [Trametes polyzona]|nr:hypothetical protein C8Q77DRAFT_1159589 [Trametes polyzona]